MQKNGIDVAKEIQKYCKDAIIVFTTTSKEFAIDAFEVNAYHYLLKPLNQKKVFECIDKIISKTLNTTPNVFQIKTNDKNILTVDVKDVSYIESISRRIAIHLKNDEVIMSTSLRAKFLESIPFDYENCNFINCHASYIVNMNDIKAISDKSFTMKNGENIPISKNLFSQVKKTYIQYLVGE
jgi:DNA-binding LytR/AlgR family response regulator